MNINEKYDKDLAPIQLGKSQLELEVYLEPTCPFSKRTFLKIDKLLSAVGENNLTITIRLLSQPWHLFSGVVTRCVLAATATKSGQKAGLDVMRTIFQHREHFVCDNHSGGPNLNRSPADILNHISELSGIDLTDAFKLDSVTRAMKWNAKYARQNGVHVTPSFAINGLINDTMGSAQSIEEWAELLGLKIAT